MDGLLGGLDRLIAKKRDLKQAAMQQLLTGQTRLPGFHGEWEVKRLGDVAHIQNGQSESTQDSDLRDGTISLHSWTREIVETHQQLFDTICEATSSIAE